MRECERMGCYRMADGTGMLCRKHATEAAAAQRRLQREVAADTPPPPALFDAMALPVLPYAGTSGHAGGDTSQDRARHADTSGSTTHRQATVLDLARAAGVDGMTWRDVAEHTGWHHGTASGALSVLHGEGYLVRLAERRAGCYVYVLPGHRAGRPTSTRRATAGTRAAVATLQAVDALLEQGLVDEARDVLQRALDTMGGP